ncbi:Gfo/Idh/MocA family oxidoreductase [Allokutzneria sp. A3M-2-11 16]|uniref:Gfo/Idh/MocA family protein n=1 Tax=Allokutzneria sp. A3M-2-11 16 TaxID=2962043 RepID=UPI0020B66C53|nr:Gfo/Idh/MocA family oxidoreductase [Allokutzneria sp. A3M-2-11 16]MCP3798473.1 Gfo/Idh/MocA family oxidoreductase [Allokutzneria sp. A3M-2-11 16]
MRASRPVAVAVVGLGNAGRQHLTAISATPLAEAVCVVETDLAAASRSALPVRDFDDVLADGDVEVVAICLPPGGRAGLVTAALAAGKHVLVEKPPAVDIDEFDALVAEAEKTDRLAAVMFQHRLALPDFLDELVTSDRLAGATATLTVSRYRDRAHYDGGGWRSNREIALGGVTAHLGVHYLDLACQLLGVPRTVTPLSYVDQGGVDTRLTGRVEFESGADLAVSVTCHAQHRFEQLIALGEKDWIELRDGRCSGEIAGRQVDVRTTSAVDLRVAVYRRLAVAVRGRGGFGRIALHRSRGVTHVLDGLLGAPADRRLSRTG